MMREDFGIGSLLDVSGRGAKKKVIPAQHSFYEAEIDLSQSQLPHIYRINCTHNQRCIITAG